MPALRELQRAFARALMDGTALGGPAVVGAATVDDAVPERGDGLPATLAGQVAADGLTDRARVGIYSNNVRASLTGAMRDGFPVVHRLVGDGFFAGAARAYLREFPSRSGDLHDLGASFADFLARFPPAAALEYLPEVARLEWAWHSVFHAPQPEPPRFPVAKLAAVPARAHAGLRLRASDASRLLATRYPVLRIWEVNQPGYAGDPVVDLDSGGDFLLVVRRDLEVEIVALARDEHAFVASLAHGATLGEACEAAVAVAPTADPAGMLRRHVALGTFVDLA